MTTSWCPIEGCKCPADAYSSSSRDKKVFTISSLPQLLEPPNPPTWHSPGAPDRGGSTAGPRESRITREPLRSTQHAGVWCQDAAPTSCTLDRHG